MNREELKTPYYIFYADEFIKNYRELEDTFREVYRPYHIAYSFKTNYTPTICELVRQLGTYAEVVSDMEYELAKRCGFDDPQIIYNGPGKGEKLEDCLLNGGHLHIDNRIDVQRTIEVATAHSEKQFCVGARVNFDIGTTLHSRFGLDLENGDYQKAVEQLNSIPNITVTGLHFHISRARGIDAWIKRIEKALQIADELFDDTLVYIDIGSGMYGHLDPELQEQFGDTPNYKDYAEAVVKRMAEHYRSLPDKRNLS